MFYSIQRCDIPDGRLNTKKMHNQYKGGEKLKCGKIKPGQPDIY